MPSAEQRKEIGQVRSQDIYEHDRVPADILLISYLLLDFMAVKSIKR